MRQLCSKIREARWGIDVQNARRSRRRQSKSSTRSRSGIHCASLESSSAHAAGSRIRHWRVQNELFMTSSPAWQGRRGPVVCPREYEYRDLCRRQYPTREEGLIGSGSREMELFGWLFSGVGRFPAAAFLSCLNRTTFAIPRSAAIFGCIPGLEGSAPVGGAFIVARHHDGQPWSRIDAFGRTVALSPDGKRL